MALNAPRAWLVAYDIADPRRLSRLHRFLKKQAVPVQYSVFCFEGSAMQLGRLARDIEDYIDPSTDDVRIYQVPEHLQCDVLGHGTLPEGVLLSSERTRHMPQLLRGRNAEYDDSERVDTTISLIEEA